MIRRYIIILIIGASTTAIAQDNISEGDNIKYFGKEYFLIEGTSIDYSVKEDTYDRLPLSYKDKVREPVWNLSKNSAGISVRFFSDSPIIKVKWELLFNNNMNHMAQTGIKGIDLYSKVNSGWRYVNTARPTGEMNEFVLIESMAPEMREYKLYLPLYDGVRKLEIGIDSLSTIKKPDKSKTKPIVFYGTSITQGGCASRPGMVYTSIISRKMDVDCINFGFSGNGRMEDPIAEIISGIDASFYVMDCLPNVNPEIIHEKTIPLTKIIRDKQSDIPIVFVENFLYTKSFLNESLRSALIEKNIALREEYDKLIEMGYSNLYYIEAEGSIGMDNEGTVDGVHLTDLGFLRFADFLIAKFDQLNLKVVE
ncbi:SGNH/GDSL hydrolase family protein [Bacteroidota bacterium]